MRQLLAIIYMISGPVFLISMIAHLYLQFVYKPKVDRRIDDSHFEFEDNDPLVQKYHRYSRLTFMTAAVSAAVMFFATFVL